MLYLLRARGAVALVVAASLFTGVFAWMPARAAAAQRGVLLEQFTATWCQYCPLIGDWMDQLQEAYPDTVVLLSEHVSASDAYATMWGKLRFASYPGSGLGIPQVWYDGLTQLVGPDPNYAGYLAAYVARAAVPTDVTLDVGAQQINGPTYTVKVRVGLLATGVPKTVRVYIVRALDHYPPDHTYYRNCLMEAVDPNNMPVIDLVPGQLQTIERTTTFDSVSWSQPGNIRLLAWAQTPDPNGVREVYQARKISWPLPPLYAIGDMNCDGSVTYADINPFVLALQSETAYKAVYPDCSWHNADCNADGSISYADINPFVLLLSAPHSADSPPE